MTNTISTSEPTSTRPPFWRNVRVLRVVAQIAAVVVVVIAIRWLFNNLTRNLDAVGIDTDFDFLDSPARFQIRDSSFDPNSSIRVLLLNGIKNTAAVASVGIALAIVLGTVIGVARLSNNWIVRKLATFYVETLRNIPPVVVIIFFGFAVFTFGRFPLFNPANPPGQIKVPGTDSNFLIYSKTRLGLPSVATGDNSGAFWFMLLIAFVIAAFVWRWRTKVNVRTGEPHHRVLYSLGTFFILGGAAWLLLGQPLTPSFPSVSESGRLIEGGLSTNDGYVSLTLALALYTASHVAEIVRGSILAVPKGQNEAANALALSGFQRYRFVVLPQAARIAIPPIINQFLNLTKNTSLAVAVAYPDVTSLTRTAIGNDQPSPQMILILMGIYLSFSLFISLVLNIVNRRLQLAGR
ncbi:amino acid ABC transporter permease [Ilumatobacter nonamiensis]|uniref:amino acid ABC transporter permease n=1 Tax=Ilumatobacter nonamiensis TaxID=467093 RepID=UPI00034D2CD3|nr:ABC transporter permease subunit [Ilumatobacter nonamiensis]